MLENIDLSFAYPYIMIILILFVLVLVLLLLRRNGNVRLSRRKFTEETFSISTTSEKPKEDLMSATANIEKQAFKLVAKIQEVCPNPNSDFDAIVSCAETDYLVAFKVSEILKKRFATIHISREWTEKLHLNPFHYDKLSHGDKVILVVWVARASSQK